MNAVIFSCSSLAVHVKAAQEKCKTAFPVVWLDRKLHAEPLKMRESIKEKLKDITESTDTVLVAMGLCGGSLSDIVFPVRTVIPNVDDCITLLLHKDNNPAFNLKTPMHFYMRDTMRIKPLLTDLIKKYGKEEGENIFQRWFKNVNDIDIVDTGVYDCHCKAFSDKAKEDAQMIGAQLHYVQGSNLLLEKLFSGRWDDQFIIAEKNSTI